MMTPRDHIEFLRKEWFSVGGGTNYLAPMLSNAVEYLSAELYTKDVHFLMEVIQVSYSSALTCVKGKRRNPNSPSVD